MKRLAAFAAAGAMTIFGGLIATAAPALAATSTLTDWQQLTVNQQLTSPNGIYTLTQQWDANLVLKKSGTVIWASNPGDYYANYSNIHTVLQGDGQLLTYGVAPGATTQSLIWPHNGVGMIAYPGGTHEATLRDDGDLALISTTGSPWHLYWETGNFGAAALAKSLVGDSYTGVNYNYWYGPHTVENWCSLYATYVWINSGQTWVNTTALVQNFAAQAESAGRWQTNLSHGAVGEAVFFWKNHGNSRDGNPAGTSSGDYVHVALIANVNPDGTVQLVDGNYGSNASTSKVTLEAGSFNLSTGVDPYQTSGYYIAGIATVY